MLCHPVLAKVLLPVPLRILLDKPKKKKKKKDLKKGQTVKT